MLGPDRNLTFIYSAYTLHLYNSLNKIKVDTKLIQVIITCVKMQQIYFKVKRVFYMRVHVLNAIFMI